MAADIRKMVRGGLDPVKERGLKAERAPIFAQVTRECYGAMKGGWKNGEHESWLPSFENHVFPIIGRMPIDQIDSADVIRVLESIWLTLATTHRRNQPHNATVLALATTKTSTHHETHLA